MGINLKEHGWDNVAESPQQEYFSVKDVGAIMQVAPSTVVRWTLKKLFPYDKKTTRTNKRFTYTAAAVAELKQNHTDDWDKPEFICDAPPHVDIETFAQLNLVSAWNLSRLDCIVVTKITNKARKIGQKPSMFLCPFCGSHELTAFQDTNGLTIWQCDCMGHYFKRNEDIIAAFLGLDVVRDHDLIYAYAKKFIGELGEPQKSEFTKPAEPAGELVLEPQAAATAQDDDITEQILTVLEFSMHDFKKLSARDKRGLTDETATRLHIGADLEWGHPKFPTDKNLTPRIICKLGDENDTPAYNAIMTNTGRKKFQWQMEQKIKWADKCLTAGKKIVFNPAALDEDIVFLTEGEIDAASICQCFDFKILACALGGKDGGRSDLIKRLTKKQRKPKIVVLFDEDARHPSKNSPTQELSVESMLKMLALARVPAVAKFLDDFMPDDDKKHFVKKDADGNILVDDNGKPVIKIDANAILVELGGKYLSNILTQIIVDAADELDALTEKYAADFAPSTVDDDRPFVPVEYHKKISKHKDKLSPEIQNVLDRVNESLTRDDVDSFLTKAKKRGHICPACGNGSGAHGTGVDFKPLPTPRVICICGWYAKAFDLFALKNNLGTEGKEFFTTLKAAADYFHVKYDPKIFEPPKPVRKNIFNDAPADNGDVDAKIAEWETVNGKIDPLLLPEIIAAEKYLAGLTVDNITAETAQSSKTKHAAAICKFYDFNATTAEKFFTLLDDIKVAAQNELKTAKSNDGLTAEPSDDTKILAKISPYNIRREVSTLVKDLRKAHSKYQNQTAYAEAKAREQQKIAERELPDELKLSDEQIKKLFGADDTDKDNAARIKYIFSNEIRYLAEDDTWFALDKTVGLWKRGRPHAQSNVMNFASKIADLLEANIPSPYDYPDAEKLVKAWKTTKRVSLAFAYLKGDESIVIRNQDLDRHKNLLNVKNGVLDLQTGRFYPTTELNPSWLITKQCNAVWRGPNFTVNAIADYLESLIPDEATREALLSFLGYSLTGNVDQQIVQFWKGTGANGKSTLINFLLELFGTYGVKLPTGAILQQRNPLDANAATNALNPIEGARLAIFNELSRNDRLNGPLVKDLSGGDKFNLRTMFCDMHIVYPTAKIVINGNFFPKPDNINDDGLLRRIRTLEFTQVFKEQEDWKLQQKLSTPDVKLTEKLTQPDSLSALLTILVAKAIKYYETGKILVSEEMNKTRNEYISDNDFLQEFIEENCVTDKGRPKAGAATPGKAFIEALRDNFRRECSQFNDKELRNLFQKRYPQFEYRQYGRLKVKCFVGIGLISAQANAAEADREDRNNQDEDILIPPDLQ